MKTKHIRFSLLIAVLLSLASSAKADVLIYNLSLTNRLMGGGASTFVVARGKLFHDIDTGEKVLLYRYVLRGVKLYEARCDDFGVSQLIVPTGTNTVLASSRRLRSNIDPDTVIGLRMFYARGANQVTELRPFRTESVARILRGISREVVDADDGNTYVVETNLEAALNLTATRDANVEATSFAELVLSTRASWDDAGYFVAADDCGEPIP